VTDHGEAADPAGAAGPVAAGEELLALRRAWAEAGQRVVLTNGCFDLLHAGHVHYLAAARALGDRLIVGLNDDDSVRRLKGPGRPLQTLEDRAAILAALRSVDAVAPFSGDTAEALLRMLLPDLYVKGGDYADEAHQPPEAAVAAELGIRVAYLPFLPGRSTSQLLDRLRPA
jgi:D-beta-D-heptose 7-phosphate kinase/D-beta-D-heptose 1-phosphate adenosyltransferase